ncbi:MAG: Bug family tripartite tricarboxylate transporter substrate binding protein [Pseudorhodobacter sp.]
MTTISIKRRGFMAGAAAAGGLLAAPGLLRAQSYATDTVRIIVGNAAGGSNDTLARFIAPVMERELGQPVIVVNRPGAGSMIGLTEVLGAKPDGHTIFCSSAAVLSVAHMNENPPGNPVTDLEHITTIGEGAFRIVINIENGIETYDQMITHLKENPGSLRHATPGFGGNIHLMTEIFKNRAGIDMPAVHYNSVGNILTDLLGNEIQVGFTGPHLTKPYIEEGKLYPLATTGTMDDADYPDIPKTIDLGLTDVDKFRNWFGLHVPKGTGDDIVNQIYEATKAALQDPDVESGIKANNFLIGGITPAEFTEVMVSEDKVYAEAAALVAGQEG